MILFRFVGSTRPNWRNGAKICHQPRARHSFSLGCSAPSEVKFSGIVVLPTPPGNKSIALTVKLPSLECDAASYLCAMS
jgi:hypothetical protein